MPRFKFSFERSYAITEGFERVIDAPSHAEAAAAAANLCLEFDQDCPDDCSEIERGHTETGDFGASCPPAYRNPVTAGADYTVLADGQVVPVGD